MVANNAVTLVDGRKMVPTAFGGHCYYVRRCVRGKQFGPDFMDREEGGVVLPQVATIRSGALVTERNLWDRSSVAEVVGVGPNVGKPCSKAHMKAFARARHIAQSAEVGDLLLFEDKNFQIGIVDSPYADYEKFVEESVPIAIYRPGE